MHVPVRAGMARRWVSGAVVVVATLYVSALVTLAAWTFVPSVFGWTPMAISSESMAPGISVGDIVVVDRHDGRNLAAGTVVTFRESGRLVTHRIDEVTDDGYVTKGDANRSPDSSLVRPNAVVGTGRVLVPALARPVVWAGDGDHAPVIAWGIITLAAAGVVAGRRGPAVPTTRQPRAGRRGAPATRTAAPTSQAWTARPTTPPTAPVRRPVPQPCSLPPGDVWTAARPPGTRRRARTGPRRLRQVTTVASLVAMFAGGLASGWIDVAAAALVGTTTSSGDWAAGLAPPTDLQGTAGCHNDQADAHVDLSWTPHLDADGYDVFRTTDPNSGYTNIARVEGGDTGQYRDTTVVDNTYHYRLEATAASFRSAPSVSVQVVVATSEVPCP